MQLKEIMSKRIAFGEPLTMEGLGVIPLLADSIPQIIPIDFMEDAVERGTLSIREMDDSGVVPFLMVENKGDHTCLLFDGEVIEGGKQNRVINATVIVMAGAAVKLPVACVEKGRWSYDRKDFQSTGSLFRARSRAKQKSSITANLCRGQSYKADQHQVWSEVSESLKMTGVHSATQNFRDAQKGVEQQVDAIVSSIQPLSNQIGAIFYGNEGVIGSELLGGADLFARACSKIVRSFAFEVISAPKPEADKAESATNWWNALIESGFSAHKSPGAGEDIRISTEVVIGSGLVFRGSLVHLSAFPVDDRPTPTEATRRITDRQSASQRKRRLK